MRKEKAIDREKLMSIIISLIVVVAIYFAFPSTDKSRKQKSYTHEHQEVQCEKILKDSLNMLVSEFCENGNYTVAFSRKMTKNIISINNIKASELILNVDKNKFLSFKSRLYEVKEVNNSLTLQFKIEHIDGSDFVYVPLDVLYKLLGSRTQKLPPL